MSAEESPACLTCIVEMPEAGHPGSSPPPKRAATNGRAQDNPGDRGGAVVEALLLVVALGVWHAVLVRLRAVSGVTRTVVRVVLGLAILGETGRFLALETLPWRTRGRSPAEVQRALTDAMDLAFWLDTAVAAALATAALTLIILSIRRAVGGPVGGPR